MPIFDFLFLNCNQLGYNFQPYKTFNEHFGNAFVNGCQISKRSAATEKFYLFQQKLIYFYANLMVFVANKVTYCDCNIFIKCCRFRLV